MDIIEGSYLRRCMEIQEEEPPRKDGAVDYVSWKFKKKKSCFECAYTHVSVFQEVMNLLFLVNLDSVS